MWPAEVFSIGITLVDVLQNWLNWFHFLFFEGGLLFILIFLSPFLDVTRMSMPIECFLLTYGLSGFKSRTNRHLLTVGVF